MPENAKPWVAYVGPFHYPQGGAAARRVLGMAEALSLAGYDVVVASGAGESTEAQYGMVVQSSRMSYCLLGERVAEHWPRPLRRLRYAWMGARTVEWLDSRPTPPVAVILYSGYTPYLRRLIPWCRRRGVLLLFDAVEWYEPASSWGYLSSPYQWNIEWAMRWLVPRVDGVIAISHYLADYYRARKVRVSIVPPTTSAIDAGDWEPAEGLRLCYAGTPGLKDDLASVLRAVARLVAQGERIHLTVAGPDRAAVLGLLDDSAAESAGWLATPGLLDHSSVQRLVGSVDFSILARRPCRTSQAGFPTKFVESFARGTPVIANLTSDLHLHLRDGETGLVIPSADADSIEQALARATALDGQAIRRMRDACLQQAWSAFHPGVYGGALRHLLEPDIDMSRKKQ